MEPPASLLLVGIALRQAPSLPAVHVGRIAGLVAGPCGAGPLPAGALRLPEPLAFASLRELRAWLVVQEPRLAAALLATGEGREPGLRSDQATRPRPGDEERSSGTAHAAAASRPVTAPVTAVRRLRVALDREARRLGSTALPPRPAAPGKGNGLARVILQDA